eukprot:scaffold2913_cov134-Pinguiococcus_pyrenoidosus.AAC.2
MAGLPGHPVPPLTGRYHKLLVGDSERSRNQCPLYHRRGDLAFVRPRQRAQPVRRSGTEMRLHIRVHRSLDRCRVSDHMPRRFLQGVRQKPGRSCRGSLSKLRGNLDPAHPTFGFHSATTGLQPRSAARDPKGGGGAASFAEGMKACPQLQTVNISRNSIGEAGAASFAEGMKACPQLRTVDISINNVGEAGAASFAEGMKACPQLQTVDISGNRIGSAGAASFAEGMKACPQLHTVGISRNSIGLTGAASFAEGMKACPQLQTVDISSNSIGEAGAASFAEGMKACPQLQS